jgi:4-amino-4-deoxy-L-arabinose transferase-like glycosyltransferase
VTARRVVLAAVLAGFALRLVFGLAYWTDKPLTLDERDYLALGANLAAGRGFVAEWPGESRAPREDSFARPPLYPVSLAPLLALDAGVRAGTRPTEVPTVVKAAQAALGALAIWLIASLTRRAAGERAAAWAAWLAAAHPPFVWLSAFALTEVLYLPLALGVALALGRVTDADRVQANGVWHAAIAGALAGLAILTRPTALFVLAIAGGWLAWRRRWLAAAAFVLAALVVVAPWTMRNARLHGRLVIVAASGGVNFWTGNHPLAIGEGDLAANPAIKAANLAFRAAHPGLTPEQLEPLYYADAFAWIRSSPGEAAWLLARKLFYSIVPAGPSYRLHSALYIWGTVLPYVVLLPLGIAGGNGLRRAALPPRALWWLALSALVSGLVFFPHERYRVPAIDPVLIVTASAWIASRGRTLHAVRPA